MKTAVERHLSKKRLLFHLLILGALSISSTALTSVAVKHENEASQADMHYERGNLFSKKGLHNEAISEYKSALESRPDHVDALFELGMAYMWQKEYGLASAQFRRLLSVVPGNKMAGGYAEYCERMEKEERQEVTHG